MKQNGIQANNNNNNKVKYQDGPATMSENPERCFTGGGKTHSLGYTSVF